jgi:lysyl-tRNA synthetase class 2
MNLLSSEFQILRSKFLRTIRDFFHEQNFLEVDTPIYKKIVGMEPYLDPFQVQSPSGNERGYLITSPEYSHKMILSSGVDKIFEITHTFRSGEKGSPIHSPEFLMLELYSVGEDEFGLMDLFESLIKDLQNKFMNFSLGESASQRITNHDLFLTHTGRGWTKNELILSLDESGVPYSLDDPYEDLYFLVFLNRIEHQLPSGIVFLYDYPPELSALARQENGVARRFEIYWDGIELANAYFELTDPAEQRKRFLHEQALRERLGKEVFPMDEDFMRCMEIGLPESAGISIGLDRLLMKILGKHSLNEVSPYW